MIIAKHIKINSAAIELTAIRSQGAGGQNVNKVASAIHLRCDIHKTGLSEIYKERLLALNDYRISSDGIIVIKAQRYRTQEQNRADALQRLCLLIEKILKTPKKRTATKPTLASKQRRIESKVRRGSIKAGRNSFKNSEPNQ